VVQFDKEASQTRDYCVAKSATRRAARPDSLGKLGTGSSPRKKRLLRMTIKLHHYQKKRETYRERSTGSTHSANV
jgi:hypothetical protein